MKYTFRHEAQGRYGRVRVQISEENRKKDARKYFAQQPKSPYVVELIQVWLL